MLTAVLAMDENGDRELKKQNPFHDFLGMSLMVGSDSPGGDASASDLGSERQTTMHLEGVPFHGLRSDASGQHMSNETVGSKRRNSNSGYTGQDGFDKLESLKMYRGGSDSEQPRKLNNEEIFYGLTALQPTSISQAIPHHTHRKNDGYSAKWDRSVTMNVPPNVQYPSCISPFVHQVPSNTFRNAAAGPSVISHVAADEGSRNGIKGSGVWNSTKTSCVSDETHPRPGGHISELSRAFVTGRKLKCGAHLPEPEAPIPGDRRAISPSSSRQMTIFYDGHAHVFDDVHPNKADVIMALAGSWSSTFSSKSSRRPVNEGSSTPTGEIETGTASNTDLVRDQQEKPPTAVTSIPDFRSSDQTSALAGVVQGSNGVK